MAMSQVCRRIVIVAYRYTGKNTVKRRRGGRDNSGARITQTNLTTNPTHQRNHTTNPTHQRNHTHDRATNSNPRPINQQPQPRSSRPHIPANCSPRPATQKRPPLYLLQQRNVLPPRPGVFLGRSLRAWSRCRVRVAPWPVRLALAPNAASRVSLAARHREWPP